MTDMTEALLQLVEAEDYVRAPQNPVAAAELLKDVASHPEYAGVAVTYPGDMWFRLARAGGKNLRFGRALAHAAQPYYLAIAGEVLSEAGALRLLAETYAAAVVLEWSGGDLPVMGDRPNLAAWLEAHEVEFDDLRAVAEDPENFLGKGRTYGDVGTVSTPDGRPVEASTEEQRTGDSKGSPGGRPEAGAADAGGRGAGSVELAGGNQFGEPRDEKPRKRKRRNRSGRKRHRRGEAR